MPSDPIIGLNAYAIKGDGQRARVAGCDGRSSKPIDIETLPRIVARCLAGRGT